MNHLTAADPFTRASPQYRDAIRRSNTPMPLCPGEVAEYRRAGTPLGHVMALIVGAVIAAIIVFGMHL